jgi:hypothetical protein
MLLLLKLKKGDALISSFSNHDTVMYQVKGMKETIKIGSSTKSVVSLVQVQNRVHHQRAVQLHQSIYLLYFWIALLIIFKKLQCNQFP